MAVFLQRTEAPKTSNKNFVHTSFKGYNKCIVINNKNGFVLASATITIEDDGSGYYIATLPADSKWDNVNFYLQQNITLLFLYIQMLQL